MNSNQLYNTLTFYHILTLVEGLGKYILTQSFFMSYQAIKKRFQFNMQRELSDKIAVPMQQNIIINVSVNIKI